MDKLQELTEKILREGVEKGQAEAAQIVADAKAQAAQIVADAKARAEETQHQAEKAAAELQANTKSELKLYMSQALNALKSKVATAVTNRVVGESVKKLAEDKDFVGKFALILAEKWAEEGAPVIAAADAEALKTYFAREAKALLDKGVKIEQVNGRSAMFSIGPADGSYRVDFGEKEFEDYFKSFLRPQIVDMLF